MKLSSPDLLGARALVVDKISPHSEEYVELIARELSGGRRIFRNGDGRKTSCPLCQSKNRRRRNRFSLSITARGGKVLVYCHRCEAEGKDIIRDLISRGLLPDWSKASSALEHTRSLRVAAAAAVWVGTGGATELSVLHALIDIEERCRKKEFRASVRELATTAHVGETTVSRTLRRLMNLGWVRKILPAQDEKAATWLLQAPRGKTTTGQRFTHAEREADRIRSDDPFFDGDDLAASPRLVVPFPHDVFRWRKGLGAVKGRVYAILVRPLKPSDIASKLGFRHARNVRLHLRRLVEHGLVQRCSSRGCYTRAEADLDAVAARLGVLGESAKQSARYRLERWKWRRRIDAFEHWRRTGEVMDPETGELLERDTVPHQRAGMRAFRTRIRACQKWFAETHQFAPCVLNNSTASRSSSAVSRGEDARD